MAGSTGVSWLDGILDQVSSLETPVYLASTETLMANMTRLENAVRAEYSHTRLAYSVKSNYLPHFVRTACAAGFLIEVVSSHELALIRAIGIPDDQVVLNGPVKSDDLLSQALRRGIPCNVDSVEELRRIAQLGAELGQPLRVGLRVAATLASGEVSRFGIDLSETEARAAVKNVLNRGAQIVGLHVHHSSNRSAGSYGERVRVLARAADLLEIRRTDLEFVNVGGGFASDAPPGVAAQLPYELSTPGEYGSSLGEAMRAEFGDNGPLLILEPGIGIQADTMAYVSRIVSVKKAGGQVLVVTDGSMWETSPLRNPARPPITLIPGTAERRPQCGVFSATVFGSTCMEIDVLGTVELDSLPAAGDLLITTNVGGYSLVLAPDFIYTQAPVLSVPDMSVLRTRQKAGAFATALRSTA